MKLLVDMNLTPEWVTFLRAANIDAVHWSTVGAPNAKDEELMRWAAAEGRVVFTNDLDFGALLAAGNANAPSVIQVRVLDLLPESADTSDPLCIAYTSDLRSWSYRIIGNHSNGATSGIVYSNSGAGSAPIASLNAHDPSVVRGTTGWWLFYTLHWDVLDSSGAVTDRRGATFRAEAASLDAAVWLQASERVFPRGSDHELTSAFYQGSAEDPSVIRVETPTGAYYQYAAGWIKAGTSPGTYLNWFANLPESMKIDDLNAAPWSLDATTCSWRGYDEVRLGNPMSQEAQEGVGVLPVPSERLLVSSGTALRWYGHLASPTTGNSAVIVAPWVVSGDGDSGAVQVTSADCFPVLVEDREYESNGVRGPAVTFFKGCWVMVYVSDIPPGEVQFPPDFGDQGGHSPL